MELVSRAEMLPVKTMYLTNFYNHHELPPLDECVKMGDGLNVELHHITKDLVE